MEAPGPCSGIAMLGGGCSLGLPAQAGCQLTPTAVPAAGSRAAPPASRQQRAQPPPLAPGGRTPRLARPSPLLGLRDGGCSRIGAALLPLRLLLTCCTLASCSHPAAVASQTWRSARCEMGRPRSLLHLWLREAAATFLLQMRPCCPISTWRLCPCCFCAHAACPPDPPADGCRAARASLPPAEQASVQGQEGWQEEDVSGRLQRMRSLHPPPLFDVLASAAAAGPHVCACRA